jgi:hypothetical protein
MRSALLALLLALPAAPAPAPDLLEIHVDPFTDMHSWVRHLAEGKGDLPTVPGLPEAVAAVRELDSRLGGSLAWGIVDGPLTQTGNAEGFARLAAELPESFTMRDGRTVRLREGAVPLAAAYRKLEKPFLETVWPRHREVAERAASTLRRDLLPKAPAVYADVAAHLGIAVPSGPFTVFLVAEAPFPGGVTYPVRGGGAVSIVAANAAEGSAWLEVVVHETLHAIDVATDSVLDELRDRLGKLSPAPSPREVHDFVHTLMFVQAAGSVRKVIDPAHKDYGDVRGYYPKVPRASAVVVPAWRAYLAGEISREAAVARIVDGFKASGDEKGGPKAAPEKQPPGQR